jgi:hypothetical protein
LGGRSWSVIGVSGLLVLAAAPTASAQDPLSAIDWLRDTIVQPMAGALPMTPPQDNGPETPNGNAITAQPLDAVRPEAVGLFPPGRVGLPRGIWGPSTAAELTALIRILPLDTLPALRDLTYRLLLAEFDAPGLGPGSPEATAEGFILARIDALVAVGALDQASALLDTLDPVAPALVARRFDIRLLLGDDEAACEDLVRVAGRAVRADTEPDALIPVPGSQTESPGPTALPARAEALTAAGSLQAAALFCQARAGDWAGADRNLNAARTGSVPLDPVYLDLLERFVDFDAHVGEGRPAMPEQPSPLAWRLLEALGEPVATQGLPVAYAHADLRGTAGWRAQIEAAERLVRSAALPPNRLLGLYTERRAAASGGIWERVRRVQALDHALAEGNAGAVADALLAVWPHIQDAELEVPFAALFGRSIMAAGLTGSARDLAATVGLLSEDYELAALALDEGGASARLRRMAAVARGLPPGDLARNAADAEGAVLAVFAGTETLPDEIANRLAEGRVGEELLRVLIRIGASGDPRMLAEGLMVLRHLGLEDIARRTALQALLLERRG